MRYLVLLLLNHITHLRTTHKLVLSWLTSQNRSYVYSIQLMGQCVTTYFSIANPTDRF